MNSPQSSLRTALGLLAFGILAIPLSTRADEQKAPPPDQAKESADTTVDPKPEPAAKAKPAADDPTRNMSEKELQKALKKYDANGNGILDDDEIAKMKADQGAKKNGDKSDLRSTQRINHSIRQSQKVRVVK